MIFRYALFEFQFLNRTIMKRLMSVLFIAVLFASCSSDDDNTSEVGIVGSWTLVELNASIPLDLNGDGTADRNIMNEIPCFEGNASFTAGGNYLLTLSNVAEEEVNGEMVFVCNGSSVNSGTYTLNGDQFTTNPDDPESETSTTTIFLNGNTLKTSMAAGNFGTVEFVLHRD